MKNKHYKHEEVLGLLPLLGSIGREIEERTLALEEIERQLESISQLSSGERNEEYYELVADAAAHRRGLRLANQELERLGCSVLGTAPVTFRIPGRVGEANRSFVWQTGDPVLK